MEYKFNFFKKETAFDGEKNKNSYINKLITDLKNSGLVNLSDWGEKTSRERSKIINILSSGRQIKEDKEIFKIDELNKESYDEEFFCLIANLNIKENFYGKDLTPDNEFILQNLEKRDLFKLPLSVKEMQNFIVKNDNNQDMEIIDKLKALGFKQATDFFSRNIKDKEDIVKNIMGYEKIFPPIWGDKRSTDDILNEMYLHRVYSIASLLGPAWSYVDILKKHSLYKENMKLEEIEAAFESFEELDKKNFEKFYNLSVKNLIKESYESIKDKTLTFEEYKELFHVLSDKKSAEKPKTKYNVNININDM